ncbi:translation initiation factor IF-2-like [Zalophus californianus]|uniref:Translation initiation factor IF-2-like n=1 Tax=Zalophus californianus TaxID=9704 RepID=A0A6P9FFH2_ZALCA|nr:translation initiation factor IF-2-like [Zalophus californianus]
MMLQVRIELTTSASPAHILLYKYRALTDCATGAPAFHFRSLATRPTQQGPASRLGARPGPPPPRSPGAPPPPLAHRAGRVRLPPRRGHPRDGAGGALRAETAATACKATGTGRCGRAGAPRDSAPRAASEGLGGGAGGGALARTDAARRLAPALPQPTGWKPEDVRGCLLPRRDLRNSRALLCEVWDHQTILRSHPCGHGHRLGPAVGGLEPLHLREERCQAAPSPLCCALFSIWTGVCVFLAWLLRSLYILKETSSHKEEKIMFLYSSLIPFAQHHAGFLICQCPERSTEVFLYIFILNGTKPSFQSKPQIPFRGRGSESRRFQTTILRFPLMGCSHSQNPV